MTKQFPAAVLVCCEYQKLLEASKRARDMWDARRAEICRLHFVGKETGDELLRLQADYARAYTLLRKHVHTCERCEPVSRIA